MGKRAGSKDKHENANVLEVTCGVTEPEHSCVIASAGKKTSGRADFLVEAPFPAELLARRCRPRRLEGGLGCSRCEAAAEPRARAGTMPRLRAAHNRSPPWHAGR